MSEIVCFAVVGLLFSMYCGLRAIFILSNAFSQFGEW